MDALVDGRRVAIRMPRDPGIFDRDGPRFPEAPAPKEPTTSGGRRAIGAIQISVDGHVPVGAADIDLASDHRPVVALGDEMTIALAIARRVVVGLVDWSRVALQQFGLGMAGELPALHDWQRVVDLETGRLYPLAITELGWTSFTPARAAPMTQVFLGQVLDGGYGEPAPAEYLLLADARRVGWRGDWPRAVLLAALACELRVKQALRSPVDAARPEGPARKGTARRRRIPAAGLFDKPMLAVAGRSLRLDDKPLYKSVITLFENRNDLMHQGVQPSEAEGRAAIKAAIGAFLWLEGLELARRDDRLDAGVTG